MKASRCLIYSQDNEQFNLLGLTLREYGIHYRAVDTFEMLGPLSESCPTLAWFIDLDNAQHSITEVSAMARRIVPDSKLVFLSSRFTFDLAQECLRERAATLLVKPVQIQRLAQCINSFKLEPELLDREEYCSEAEEPDSAEENQRQWTEEPVVGKSRFTCPFCSTTFESYRFKQWKFHVSEIETDFSPIFPKGAFPELYLMCVCPQCLYANSVGRFERHFPKEKEKATFLEGSKLASRRELIGKLDFSGERRFQEGYKSFDLAGMVAAELQFGDWDTFYGELLLKTSWLCRRMGKKNQEQQSQNLALQHYLGLYRPYLRRDGVFRRKAEILSRLPRGKTLLPDRTIIFTGFMVAELSRRLSLLDQAEAYFSEALRIPFLPSYPFLQQHIRKAYQLLPSHAN